MPTMCNEASTSSSVSGGDGVSGSGAAGAQMLAHGFLRQFGMDRRQLEMKALLAGDLAHDAEHEIEPLVAAAGPRTIR